MSSWYSLIDDGKSTLFVHPLPLQRFSSFHAYSVEKQRVSTGALNGIHHGVVEMDETTGTLVTASNTNAKSVGATSASHNNTEQPLMSCKDQKLTLFSENEQLEMLDSLMSYMQLMKTANLQPAPKLLSLADLAQEDLKAETCQHESSPSQRTSIFGPGVKNEQQQFSDARPMTNIEGGESFASRSASFLLRNSSSFRVERIEGTIYECSSHHVNCLLEALDRTNAEFMIDDVVPLNIEACVYSTCSGDNPTINAWLKQGNNVVFLLPVSETLWVRHERPSKVEMSDVLNDQDPVKLAIIDRKDTTSFQSSLPGTFVVPFETAIVKKRKDQLQRQNDKCPNCLLKIEKGFILSNNARFCHYTGYYFCTECHKNSTALIPARVFLNWDFHAYKVCEKSLEFLNHLESIPCYRLNDFNIQVPRISRSLLQVKVIRTQLAFLRDYFQSCRFSDNTWGNTLLGGRTHFAESLDIFSIRDLRDLENNTLIPQLKAATQKLISHVLQCPICRMKGFICEICHDPRVIFPFQLRTVARCQECRTFYHRSCFQDIVRPCPKCLRLRKRLTDKAFTTLET